MNTSKSKNPVVINEISIEEKVDFLQQSQSYPYFTDHVGTKETHMSWVFLVNGFAYKMKKPVKYDLFDHRTLKSRLINSREEIRINRELARDIYLGLIPLVINNKKKLQLDGKGQVVDWLIKMKRIPEECMLDYAIRNGRVDQQNLMRTIDFLIKFYKSSPGVPIDISRHIKKLKTEIETTYLQLTNPVLQLPEQVVEDITAAMRSFFTSHYSILKARIDSKKIIEAHGDLRPEHICLSPQPSFIDRLEFSKELRIMDVAEELSFLSMECEIMGEKKTGAIIMEEYMKETHDEIPDRLISFYKIKRACLRTFLVARHIEEPRYQHDTTWSTKANKYLNLAEMYHKQLVTG